MTVSSNYSAYSSNSSSGVSSASQKGKPDFEKMAQELLSSLDTDKSGSIDKAEFSAAAQALASSSSSSATGSSSATDIFSTLDTNSDGSMSTEELVASLKNMKPPEGKGDMPPPPGAMPPPPSDSSSTSNNSTTSSSSDIIDAMDTNKDGTVSIDELLAALENLKTDSSKKNNGTASATDSSTASSTSQTENTSQKFSDVMLKNILSYYGNNTSTASSTSLLSISA